MIGITRAGFLHDEVAPIHHVMPRTAVPVIVACEVKNACALDIEGHVEVIRVLAEKMAGVGGLVCTASIVGATHVGAHADALLRPALPHSIRVKADWDYRQ